MELELGLALPNHNPSVIQVVDLKSTEDRKDYSKKRVSTTLSLLLWSDGHRQPEAEDDGGRPPKWRKHHVVDDDDDCQEIEGWPPINSSRQEPPRRCHDGSTAAEQVMRKSMHVKVKMEGVAIGRKVDLRDCDSYHVLTNILMDMFAKYTKIERRREEYTLLYQDKEGDWMLVGDVQWEVFVESVQRVEILKNDNKMGFRLLSPNI